MDKDTEKSEAELTNEKKEAEIAAKLTGLEQKVEGTEVLVKLLADPDVRSILEAKQKGEEVKIVLGKAKEIKKAPIVVDVDLEALSNKELVRHLLERVTDTIDSSLSSKLEPLSSSIKALESYVGSAEAKTVGGQIDEAKKKYADFDDYLPVMKSLNKSNPELSVEELYLISRKRKGGKGVLEVSSEKPTSTSAKVKAEKIRDAPLPRGRAGFDQLLQEALDNLEISET